MIKLEDVQKMQIEVITFDNKTHKLPIMPANYAPILEELNAVLELEKAYKAKKQEQKQANWSFYA